MEKALDSSSLMKEIKEDQLPLWDEASRVAEPSMTLDKLFWDSNEDEVSAPNWGGELEKVRKAMTEKSLQGDILQVAVVLDGVENKTRNDEARVHFLLDQKLFPIFQEPLCCVPVSKEVTAQKCLVNVYKSVSYNPTVDSSFRSVCQRHVIVENEFGAISGYFALHERYVKGPP